MSSRAQWLLVGICATAAAIGMRMLVDTMSASRRAEAFAARVDRCWEIMASKSLVPEVLREQTECRPLLKNQVTQRFRID